MLCPQTGYAETSMHISFQEIEAVGSCSDHVIRHSICSPHCRVRVNHVKLFIYGFSFLCRCAEATQMVSCSAHMVQCIAQLYVHHCFYIMSPALSRKSSVQFGNPEQCALAFTHLLSSSCTYYFVPFHTHVCAYCKCISLVV